MGITDGRDSATDVEAQIYDMLEDSRCGGQMALYSMMDDLSFFSEMLEILRCTVRLLRAGVKLPEEAGAMGGWISDEEVRVLEKWALFLELM